MTWQLTITGLLIGALVGLTGMGGGSLMTPVLERCDRAGLGAYLESSKPENLPYYERFGFRVTGQFDMPKGPPMWPMWRDPQ